MTTKNAIEAAKITKELKNFTLDVENFAIPQGFATALILSLIHISEPTRPY